MCIQNLPNQYIVVEKQFTLGMLNGLLKDLARN